MSDDRGSELSAWERSTQATARICAARGLDPKGYPLGVVVHLDGDHRNNDLANVAVVRPTGGDRG